MPENAGARESIYVARERYQQIHVLQRDQSSNLQLYWKC